MEAPQGWLPLFSAQHGQTWWLYGSPYSGQLHASPSRAGACSAVLPGQRQDAEAQPLWRLFLCILPLLLMITNTSTTSATESDMLPILQLHQPHLEHFIAERTEVGHRDPCLFPPACAQQMFPLLSVWSNIWTTPTEGRLLKWTIFSMTASPANQQPLRGAKMKAYMCKGQERSDSNSSGHSENGERIKLFKSVLGPVMSGWPTWSWALHVSFSECLRKGILPCTWNTRQRRDRRFLSISARHYITPDMQGLAGLQFFFHLCTPPAPLFIFRPNRKKENNQFLVLP